MKSKQSSYTDSQGDTDQRYHQLKNKRMALIMKMKVVRTDL